MLVTSSETEEGDTTYSYTQSLLPINSTKSLIEQALAEGYASYMNDLDIQCVRAVRAKLLNQATPEDEAKLAFTESECTRLRAELNQLLEDLPNVLSS